MQGAAAMWMREGRALRRHPREAGGAGQYDNRGRGSPKASVIQRPQAVESPGQGHAPNSGRVRVAFSSVILA